jgi:hypothetical protein
MRRKMARLTFLALLAAAATGLPAIAEARVNVDIGIGVPGPRYRPHYYAPHYYVPPPVYYYPPPAVVYAPPPPIVYTPAPPPATAQANCHTYNGDATLDGRGTPFYGTACLQPDGKWHIVN